MRDLKFRCFNKDDDYGMFYGGFSIHATAGKFLPDSILNDAENGDYVVMQFTGLTDRNGKDIYEGDIIKVINYQRNGDINTDVIWWENYGCWAVGKIQSEFITKEWGHQSLEHVLKWNTEVIGNIYQDSHLLKG